MGLNVPVSVFFSDYNIVFNIPRTFSGRAETVTDWKCSLPVIFKHDLFTGKRTTHQVLYNILLSVPLYLHHVALCSSSPTGQTEEHIKGCLARETTWTIILYTEHSSVTRCSDNRMTQKYQGVFQNLTGSILCLLWTLIWSPSAFLHSVLKHFFGPGSYIQAAEKSFSMVTGGRVREAAALAWERQGPAPDRTSYKNWAKSVLDNPAVVESKVTSSTAENRDNKKVISL